MGPAGDGSDEPLTPIGRVFFHKELVQVIHLAVGMKHQIDVEAVKAAMKDSVMVKHPRFCSLIVRDGRGVDHWKRTDIDIDNHFIVVDDPVGSISNRHSSGDADRDDEAAVNEYLADMSLSSSSAELSDLKPLWEIHVLKAHKCMVLRIHHTLGDGTSLVSMMLALCRRVDYPDSLPTMTSSSSSLSLPSSWFQKVAKLVQRVWLTVVVILGLCLRSTWVRDSKNPITGGDGVELWPRKLTTARFRIDDMKLVKRVVPGATINDVLTGVISLGLHKYFDKKWPGSVHHGTRMTGIASVNLRKQPGLQELTSLRWGNVVGFMLLPMLYNNNETTWSNPLDHVAKAKAMLDRKKSSLEAALACKIGNLVLSWFGINVVACFIKQLICNTTFSISNMVGPQELISYVGNPITYIRASALSTTHALSMIMMSYAGRADLQILVAKDIIPDPEFLAECFEGALMDIKAAVAAKLVS